jgi:hypothetical protein
VQIFEWKRICAGFFLFVCIVVGDPIIRGGGWDLLNWFNPTFFVCLFVLLLEIQLSDEDCWDSINWFNPT